MLSDERGRYEMVNLPPGRYILEFSYTGLQAAEAAGRRPAGRGPDPQRHLHPGADRGGGGRRHREAPLTRPDSTHTGSTRDADTLARLPTGRSYQNAAQQVPGVSGGANPNIKGGLASSNRYLIDDMDITDPVTNTFTSNLTFDSIQSVEILTGGTDAEYNALGGVINIIPKGGGDEFHALAAAYVNHYRLSSQGNQGAQPLGGDAALQRDRRGAHPALRGDRSTSAGPSSSASSGTASPTSTSTPANSLAKGPPLGVAPYDVRHPHPPVRGPLRPRARSTSRRSAKHRFRLSLFTDPTDIDNTGQSNTYLGVAESHQDQGGKFGSLRWDWLANGERDRHRAAGHQPAPPGQRAPGALRQGRHGRLRPVLAGQLHLRSRTAPGASTRPTAPPGTRGRPTSLHERNRIQFDPSVSLRGIVPGPAQRQDRHPGPVRLALPARGDARAAASSPTPPRAGALLEAGLCNPATGLNCDRRTDLPSFETRQRGYAAGLFLQDHWWTSLQWLTINPGVRFDYGVTYNRNGDQVTNLFGIGPRLGLTADVTRDGRNILFAYYGRATNALPLDVVANVDDAEAGGSKVYQWDPMTRDYTTMIQQTGGPGRASSSTRSRRCPGPTSSPSARGASSCRARWWGSSTPGSVSPTSGTPSR